MSVAPVLSPSPEQLSQMIEEITGELALEPLLPRLVERACALIGADEGLISLYVPERDSLRAVAISGVPPEQIAVGAEVGRGQGLAGLVLARDAVVHCRYGDLPLPVTAGVADNDVIGMPIRDRDGVVGVFGVCAHAPRRLPVEAEPLLALFARHAAVAIGNARRYAREQRRASRFALIARVAGIIASAPELDVLLQRAADAMHELLEYQNVDIPLIEPDAADVLVIRTRGGDYKRRIQHVDRIPMGVGIMGAAAATGRAQLVNDVAADPRYVTPPGVRASRAELAVPIQHGEDVLGVLNVEGDHEFDELDQVSLEIVAEHLGLAIVNARLFERSKQLALLEERQRLARDLHDNVTQILSSMSLITQSLADAWRREPAEGERRAQRLAELARLAFAELRAMLHELSPDPRHRQAATAERTPRRLADRLQQLLHVMVPPQVRLDLDEGAFPPQAEAHEEAILRVCQEAVSNAVRHAAPSRIQVSVTASVEELHIRVCDDGRGIGVGASRGRGLDNMRQRLAELGGRLRIARQRPHGTLIAASLPRQDRGAP